jgi:hypothetical protein
MMFYNTQERRKVMINNADGEVALFIEMAKKGCDISVGTWLIDGSEKMSLNLLRLGAASVVLFHEVSASENRDKIKKMIHEKFELYTTPGEQLELEFEDFGEFKFKIIMRLKK